MLKFVNKSTEKPSDAPSWPPACGDRWCLNGPPGDSCTTFWLCTVCSKACDAGNETTKNSTSFSALLQLKLVEPKLN